LFFSFTRWQQASLVDFDILRKAVLRSDAYGQFVKDLIAAG